MTRTSFVVAFLWLAPILGFAAPAAAAEAVAVEVKAVKIQGVRAAKFDSSSLTAFVQSRRGILECYREELANDRRAHGRLLVKFTVDKTGDVTDVEVLRSELPPRLAECVTNIISSWATPFRPEGPIAVECPLVFTPAG